MDAAARAAKGGVIVTSVLISIRPEWCEKIASGQKTVEVRKTKPKLKTPFMCYIYCVDGNTLYKSNADGAIRQYRKKAHETFQHHTVMNKKVIGEFVCDAVFPISVTYSDENSRIALREFPYTGMTDRQIMDYLGNGKTGYGWHISNLVIYDIPLEIGGFMRCPCDFAASCGACVHSRWSVEDYSKFIGCSFEVKRPPQSWCYVEDKTI